MAEIIEQYAETLVQVIVIAGTMVLTKVLISLVIREIIQLFAALQYR